MNLYWHGACFLKGYNWFQTRYVLKFYESRNPGKVTPTIYRHLSLTRVRNCGNWKTKMDREEISSWRNSLTQIWKWPRHTLLILNSVISQVSISIRSGKKCIDNTAEYFFILFFKIYGICGVRNWSLLSLSMRSESWNILVVAMTYQENFWTRCYSSLFKMQR